MRREVVLGYPVTNLARAVRVERRGVETGNSADPAFLSADASPEILATCPDAGDWPDPGDDRPPLFSLPHRLVLTPRFEMGFHVAQRFARNVVDEKVADDLISHPRECRYTKAQVVHDFDQHTPGTLLK